MEDPLGETNREHSVKTKVKVRRKKEATRTSQADDDVMIDSVKVAEKIDVSAAIQEALIQVKGAREAAEAANTKAAASALEMERLREELDETRKQLIRKGIDLTEEDGVPEEDETKDILYEEKPQSVYCFCVERLLIHPVGFVNSLVTMLKLLLITSCQVILTFAFQDASWLQSNLGGFRAFLPPIDGVNWYRDSLIETGGDKIATVNFLASIAALILLASGPLLSDATQTILTPQPLVDLVVFRVGSGDRPAWRWLLDIPIVLVLHAAWAARALFIPTMAAHGTAMAMANADDAFDIVLNSVAIGFVFELDDYLYPAIISRMDRSAYENSPPVKGTPLAVGGAPTLCGRYVWLLAVFDAGIMIVVYRKWIFPSVYAGDASTDPSQWGLWQIGIIFIVHGGLYGLAAVHCQLHALMSSNGIGGVLGGVRFAAKALLSLGLLYATVFAAHVLGYQGIGQAIGSTWALCVEPGSQFYECINEFGGSLGCAEGLLSVRADPNSTSQLYSDYSYDPGWYSMRYWGRPIVSGCLPPRGE